MTWEEKHTSNVFLKNDFGALEEVLADDEDFLSAFHIAVVETLLQNLWQTSRLGCHSKHTEDKKSAFFNDLFTYIYCHRYSTWINTEINSGIQRCLQGISVEQNTLISTLVFENYTNQQRVPWKVLSYWELWIILFWLWCVKDEP